MKSVHFASKSCLSCFELSHLLFLAAAAKAEINIGGLNFDKIPPEDS